MKGYDLNYKMHLLELYDKSGKDSLASSEGTACSWTGNRAGRLISGVQRAPSQGEELAQVKLLTNLCQGIYISLA